MDNRTTTKRRGGQQPQAPVEEVRPLLTTPPKSVPTIKPGNPKVPAPPRSGNFGLPVDNDKDDYHGKRKYRVNLPTRMLFILAMVFVAVPLLVFFYKEVHIHEDHDHAHYKAEKFVNVDTNQMLSNLEHHAKGAKHQGMNKMYNQSKTHEEISSSSKSADASQEQPTLKSGKMANATKIVPKSASEGETADGGDDLVPSKDNGDTSEQKESTEGEGEQGEDVIDGEEGQDGDEEEEKDR